MKMVDMLLTRFFLASAALIGGIGIAIAQSPTPTPAPTSRARTGLAGAAGGRCGWRHHCPKAIPSPEKPLTEHRDRGAGGVGKLLQIRLPRIQLTPNRHGAGNASVTRPRNGAQHNQAVKRNRFFPTFGEKLHALPHPGLSANDVLTIRRSTE